MSFSSKDVFAFGLSVLAATLALYGCGGSTSHQVLNQAAKRPVQTKAFQAKAFQAAEAKTQRAAANRANSQVAAVNRADSKRTGFAAVRSDISARARGRERICGLAHPPASSSSVQTQAARAAKHR